MRFQASARTGKPVPPLRSRGGVGRDADEIGAEGVLQAPQVARHLHPQPELGISGSGISGSGISGSGLAFKHINQFELEAAAENPWGDRGTQYSSGRSGDTILISGFTLWPTRGITARGRAPSPPAGAAGPSRRKGVTEKRCQEPFANVTDHAGWKTRTSRRWPRAARARSIRANSRSLAVTRAWPRGSACAAISRSLAPIGCPARSRLTRSWP